MRVISVSHQGSQSISFTWQLRYHLSGRLARPRRISCPGNRLRPRGDAEHHVLPPAYTYPGY